MAVASGWMERAASLLEDTEECAGHGWLILDRAPFTDDAKERRALATAALAIARRFGDVDLEYDALSLLGQAYVAVGRVSEGMKLLDQAMTAVSAGEVVGIVPISDIYCRLLARVRGRAGTWPVPRSGWLLQGASTPGVTSFLRSAARTTAGS